MLYLSFVDKSVKPYKKLGEEAESDHGTDDEAEGLVLRKKKRVIGKKRKNTTGDDSETITTAPAKKLRRSQAEKRSQSETIGMSHYKTDHN